jgi:hypothetical protein
MTSKALAAADFTAASLIVSIVPAIITCCKLILEISKLKEAKKPVDEKEWRSKLEEQLTKHKLPPKKAKAIAADFARVDRGSLDRQASPDEANHLSLQKLQGERIG